jgi:hypothetical protein
MASKGIPNFETVVSAASKAQGAVREAGMATAGAKAAAAATATGATREAGMAAADKAAAARAKAAADKARADAAAKAKADQLKKNLAARANAAPVLMNDEILSRSKFLRADTEATPPSGNQAASGVSNGGNAGGSVSAANVGTPTNSPAIKVATPDIITIDQETLPAELMTSMIFENIGGQELLSISRHDLISGSNMDYQAIKNLRDVYLNNNPLNIIPMPDLSNNYAKNFPIVWESHIIEEFSSLDSTHIYLDNAKKELNLLVTNMKPGEQVEVEILSSVTGYNATKF